MELFQLIIRKKRLQTLLITQEILNMNQSVRILWIYQFGRNLEKYQSKFWHVFLL